LGPEYTSTLNTVKNLGNLYSDQDKLVEAEQMLQRALQGYEKVLGPEHTSMLRTVNNLGNLYSDQGKLALAEQMFKRALRGYEKALGADNITTYIPVLNTMWGLGSLFQRQADFVKARIIYSKALVGYEKVDGPNYPRSRSLRGNLQALDTVTENEILKDVEEPVNKSRGETSINPEVPPTSDPGFQEGLLSTDLLSDTDDEMSVNSSPSEEDCEYEGASGISVAHDVNRIMNPGRYFKKLDMLEETVYNQSVVNFYKPSDSYSPWAVDPGQFESQIPLPKYEVTICRSSANSSLILSLCNDIWKQGS
jgi:tetratricopeptide (TPR) repeat protein